MSSSSTSKESIGRASRHITISTVGVIPGIRALADRPLPVNLAVSLHAANDRLRDELVRQVLDSVPGVVRNGDPDWCLPGIASLTFDGCAGDSLLLLLEALARAPPSVLLDTTGYGYCYAAAKALGVRRVGCYVHYPILSSEMARDDAR